MSERVAKRKALPVDFAVYDIETEAWDSFVCGGLRHSGITEIYWHDREDDYVSRLLDQSGSLYAHNGGRFDALWLLQHMADRDCIAQITIAGASVVSIKLDKGDGEPALVVRDSARLVPMSLDKFGKMFDGPRKAETNLPCRCSDEKKAWYLVARGKPTCGGYCSISRVMEPELRRKLDEYLAQDLITLEASLGALETYCERNDIDLGGTIGGSAWSTALRCCDLLTAADWGRAIDALRGGYALARKGYFGGRVTVGRTRAPRIFSHDINSAYPAALRNLDLPVGTPQIVDQGAKFYNSGREGILTARVDVPLSHCPPLPLRTPGPRISYPTGEFIGEWTALELRHAESVGVRVRSIGRAIYWPTTERIFVDYIDRIYRLRARAIREHEQRYPDEDGKKSPLAVWLKFLANSLTGKFAQDPESEALACGSIHLEKMFCRAPALCMGDLCRSAKCCMHFCKRACGAWEMFGTKGRFFIRDIISYAPSMHIQFAAYLTASTRRTLHREMGDDTVYTDTDNVKRLLNRTQNVGEELGQFQFEGTYRDWHCIAPKVYGCTVEDNGKPKDVGKHIGRAKGIPDADANWSRIVNGEEIELGGVHGLKSALRRGDRTFLARDESRVVKEDSVYIGDRIRLAGGRTRPPTIDEARARV